MGLAEAICLSAFAVELTRALSGNALSWAYVFEWPIFAGYALYVWRRLVTEERTELAARDHGLEGPPPPVAPDDPALAAYNAYLEGVHGRPTPPPASEETSRA